MDTQVSKKDRIRILFLTIAESATLLNLKNYIFAETDTKFDYMLFGLPRNKNSKTTQDIHFVTSTGRNIDKSISFNISFKEPFGSLFKFIIHCYAFFILLKIIKHEKYDICIAETSTLGMLAWILEKIGKCRMTVFFAGDIYATQFKGILGFILVFSQKLLRKMSYKNNLIWYINGRLKKWDLDHGFMAKDSFIGGIFAFDYKKVIKYSKHIRNMCQLSYIGRIDQHAGLDVVIRSIKYIKQKIPNITFTVIGGYSEDDLFYYKGLAKKEKVSDRIQFLGFVKDTKEAEKIIAGSALGMAVYDPRKESGTSYTDPGKVRDYLETGTPVVITKKGLLVVKDIERYNAGITVDYDPLDIAEKIIKVLKDEKKYKILQEGVAEFTQSRLQNKVIPPIYKKILNSYGNYKKELNYDYH